MKLIKFDKETLDDEIFKELRGKPFFAVSVTSRESGNNTYRWHTHEMTEEVIIMGIELLKNAILNDLIEVL